MTNFVQWYNGTAHAFSVFILGAFRLVSFNAIILHAQSNTFSQYMMPWTMLILTTRFSFLATFLGKCSESETWSDSETCGCIIQSLVVLWSQIKNCDLHNPQKSWKRGSVLWKILQSVVCRIRNTSGDAIKPESNKMNLHSGRILRENYHLSQ